MDSFYGMPMIRDGDHVFILGKMPSAFDWMASVREISHRIELSMHDYRCPFSILDEFDEWWEWHRKVHFERQSTGQVMAAMGCDRDTARACRVERPFRIYADYGFNASHRRNYVTLTAV